MHKKKIATALLGPAILVSAAALLWTFRSSLFPHDSPNDSLGDSAASPAATEPSELTVLELSAQARKNLALVSKPARPTDYWRTVTIPGAITDQPGVSDRGVTSPAVGVVAEIHAYPGDTVRPRERLVTIRLFSEYLQTTQTQLFKAMQEILLLQTEIDRLSDVANTGAVAQSRIIDLRNNISRQNTIVQAARQELLSRGLHSEQVQQIESGSFISTIEVTAPGSADDQNPAESDGAISRVNFVDTTDTGDPIAYEVEGLAVELGQTVQAGQLLASLANHQSLYAVGHAFKREAGFLEQAAQEGRPIEVEFADDSSGRWPPLERTFHIRHLSNSIDPESRTFDFFVPLENQSRVYQRGGETFLVWRFRPGQRVRIHVPVEKYSNVFVLPAEAVVHEGPEAFVFRQNGDLFNQISVHILHEDRRNIVIANDGSITPGTFLAQNAAASLNRVLKAQSASGEQPGLHIHADGTVHAAH